MQLLENCLGCFCVTRNKQHSIEISADLAYLSFLFIKDSCTKRPSLLSPPTPPITTTLLTLFYAMPFSECVCYLVTCN